MFAAALFTPPKGMVRVAESTLTKQLLRSQRGGTFVAEYRGTTKYKPAWSSYTYPVSETVFVAFRSSSANAQEWGIRNLSEMTSVPQRHGFIKVHVRGAGWEKRPYFIPATKALSWHAVTLCNGQRGWRNILVRDQHVYEQVFARAGNRIYIAMLRYDQSTGDVLHAGRSLRSLCPKGVGEKQPVARTLPMQAPLGWTRGVSDLTHRVPPPFTSLAYWYHLPGKSTVAQWLYLTTGPDASEYIRPEDEAARFLDYNRSVVKTLHVLQNRAVKLCSSADAWALDFTAVDRIGRRFSEEYLFAYGQDSSYEAWYVREAHQPEDPAAHKALYSLCPPQSAI